MSVVMMLLLVVGDNRYYELDEVSQVAVMFVMVVVVEKS